MTHGCRAGTVVLVLGVALFTCSGVAAADRRQARDPDDFGPSTDIRRVLHGHGGHDGDVRHSLRTHGKWRSELLQDNNLRMGFDFSIDGHSDVERRIVLRKTRGGLRATMYGGRYLQNERRGRIRVWRRDRRSVRITFASDLLRRRHLGRYWWRAWASYESCPVDDQTPCLDAAPRRLIEHDL
jgi:hypothetical protein